MIYSYIRALKFLKEHSVFVCLLLLCAVLRLIPLFDYQFTYDELSGLERTQFTSFAEVIEKGVKIDAHPALVQVLIYYLVKFFGYTGWILKLPFLLCGFGAIVYAYAFGYRNFSKQAGLLMALFFSFSLIFVFYAPIARMYITGVFFSMALLYYFFELFFRKNTGIANYFFLGLFAWLSALNQHINSLFAFTVCLSGLFFLSKTNYKAYLVTCLLVVLAYLPHLPVTLYQLSVPGIGVDNGGWLEAPRFGVIFSFLKTVSGTGRTYIFLLFIIFLSFLADKRIPPAVGRRYLVGIFVVNFLVVYMYSVLRTPVFQYSVMLFSATAFIAFICSFVEFKSNKAFYSLFAIMGALLLYKTYLKKDYLHQCVKTVFDYQFERTVHYKQLYGDKAVYPIFFDADNIMKRIYFEKYNTRFDCVISADSMIANMDRRYYAREQDPYTGEATPGFKVSTLRLFSECVSRLKCDYLVLSSAMPQHQAVAQQYFPYLIENTQTQGINYKVYSKKAEDKGRTVNDDVVYYFSSPVQKGAFIYPMWDNALQKDPQLKTVTVDTTNEFPFEASAALSEVTKKEGQVVLVSARVKIKTDESPLELCIALNDTKDDKQYAYNAKAVSDFVMAPDSTVTIYSEHFNGVIYDAVKYKTGLKTYLWNRGKEHFELQSFGIKVIDYWSPKWDLWD